MVVIADASPLNYLVLVEQIDLLHRSFGEVLVPDAVIEDAMKRNPQTQLGLLLHLPRIPQAQEKSLAVVG